MIRLVAAIGLAGLGHYFVAFQRELYPIDGYVYYAAAAILFVWVLRSARGLPQSDWSAVRDPLVQVVSALRRLIAAFFHIRFGPTLVISLIVLNLIAALLAVVVGSWIALIGWGLSIVWLAVTVWPRPQRAPSPEVIPPVHAALVEMEEGAAAKPRLPLMIAAVLMIVLGQLVLSGDQTGGVFGGLGDSLAERLRLQLPGGGSALVGLGVLALGTIVFGVATRGMKQSDRPALSVEVRLDRRKGWGGAWLGVAVIGFGLWLMVLRAIADGASGFGPLALWIAALALIGAVWHKIDLDRGVRFGILVARREAAALAGLMIAALVIGLFQLDRLPASIWGDEGAYWTLTRDTASGLVPFNVFGLGTYSYPFGGSVYQALWVSVFGPTIFAWRVGQVSALVASMLPLYFLARSLLGRRVAVVSLAFFATAPIGLAYARTGYLFALAILPVTAGVALIVAALRRDSRLFAFLAGVANGIGFMLVPSAQFGVALCVLTLIGFAAARMTHGRSLLRLALSYTSAGVVAIAPALVFGLVREPAAYLDKLFQTSMINTAFADTVIGRDELLAQASFFTTRDSQLFFEPSMYAGLAVRGWARTLIGLHRATFYEHYVVGPLAGPLTLLYLIGLGWCLARLRRPGYGLWPIWLITGTVLLSALQSFPPHVTDMLPMLPALAVLAAIGLVGLLDGCLRPALRGGLVGQVNRGALIAATIIVSGLGLRAYFFEMPQQYPPSLDMRMFWSAQAMPRGSTVVFVRDEAYPPDFAPWGMQNFDTGVNWQVVEPAALPDTDLRPACAMDCRVFYTPTYAEVARSYLDPMIGPGTETTYSNQTGDVIGYSYEPR